MQTGTELRYYKILGKMVKGQKKYITSNVMRTTIKSTDSPWWVG